MKDAYESLDELDAWELDEYADGKPMPQIAKFFDQHPEAFAQWSKEERGLAKLKQNLFRIECPPTEQLQAYHWGDLQASERLSLEKHLQLCPLCTEELQTLRTFVPTTESVIESQPSLSTRLTHTADQLQAKFDQVRMVVANLLTSLAPQFPPQFPPQFAPVGLRSEPSDTATRGTSQPATLIYEVEEITISLTIRQQDAAQKTLWGQLLAPDATDKHKLTLIAADPNQPERTTQLNASGNFEFSNLAAGIYQLQIFTDEATIVIPNLHLL